MPFSAQTGQALCNTQTSVISDCHDILVIGTRVAISDTARDLGVVIDGEMSLAALVQK